MPSQGDTQAPRDLTPQTQTQTQTSIISQGLSKNSPLGKGIFWRRRVFNPIMSLLSD